MPIFSSTPARMTEPPVGACVCASGSQVCSGNSGTFTANAIANAKNSHRPVLAANVGVLGDLDQVERDLAVVGLGQHGRGDDADQHERRADHREQEELRGRVDAVVVAPAADEEVHRHEHDLEEHEEQEQVEADEAAHHAGFEQQHPRQVALVVVVRVDAGDHQREQHAGEHDQEQRDAVDAEVPRDAPRLDPRVLLTNWKPALFFSNANSTHSDRPPVSTLVSSAVTFTRSG